MKDEIKEILDNQKLINVEDDYERIIFEYLANNCSEFSDEHIKQLVNLKVKQYKQALDYITNLQEELKSANESITWWQNRFNALQEENQRLKEVIHKNDKEIDNLCKNQKKEIERLNNIINRMEEDLKEMYMTFGEFNEEYTEKKISELKGGE